MQRLQDIELFAWIGEDELGSGEMGIKIGACPAGLIPMVSITRKKVEQYSQQFESQASTCGKRIYLCKFSFTEVVLETKNGA